MQDSDRAAVWAAHNDAMKSAHEASGDACCGGGKCHPKDDAPKQWKHLTAESAAKYAAHVAEHSDDIRSGSREFIAVLDEMKVLHLRKTKDYGIDEDALSNVRQGADVVNLPAWGGCMIRISDKMHRVRAFFRRGVCEFDGIEDTLIDVACYAVIALVLYREWRNKPDGGRGGAGQPFPASPPLCSE